MPTPRKPPLALQVTTLWDYASQHYGTEQQGSSSFRGATPSYVIWNVINRFTKEGETVLDPFCGSGTTLDVCEDTRRHGVGFDVAPTRPDIGNADARSLPLKQKSVDLVFFDPPYADNLTYSDDPRCLGKLKADGQMAARHEARARRVRARPSATTACSRSTSATSSSRKQRFFTRSASTCSR